MFRTDEFVDQLTFHFQFDGDVIMKESDEAREQEDFWENKKRLDKGLLDKINQAIKEEYGKDYNEGSDKAQKKALRNQFNFQERAAQTFNLPLREKGMKTDPPHCTEFQVETTQWMIFDAYMQQYEEMLRVEAEEANKGKKDKKNVQVQ